MGLTKFASWQAFRVAFDAVFENVRFFLPLMTGFAIFSAIMYFVVFSATRSTLLSDIIAIIINSAIALALFKIGLGFLDSHQLSRTNLFVSGEFLLKYIAASLLFWVMVYAGLMLLIVPGVYVLLTYSFYGLEMVDKNLGPIEAMKRSAEITKGAKWSLLRLGFEFYFGLIAINVLLLVLVLFPFVSLGVVAVFLQAMHLTVLSFIMSPLMSAIPVVVFLIMALLDAIIVIPGYALTFTSIYRFLEPKRADAGATVLVDMQGSEGERAPTEAALSDPIDDSSKEKTS